MTSKDYIVLAGAFVAARDNALEADNSRFDRELFVSACCQRPAG